MRYFLLLFLILLAGCSPDSSNTPGPTPAVDSSPNGFMAQVATTYQDADIYQDPVNMTQFIIRHPDGSVWSIHCSLSGNVVQITSAARLFKPMVPDNTAPTTNQSVQLERPTPYH